MTALRKEEVLNEFDELIESMSKEEKQEFILKLRRIKANVEQLLKQQDDDEIYRGIVNKSMQEIWDNDKDALYDEL